MIGSLGSIRSISIRSPKVLHTGFILILLYGLSGCAAFQASSTPTPTLDAARWKIFQDIRVNFSFQYPASYIDRPLCAIKIKSGDVSAPGFMVSMDNSELKISFSPLQNQQETDPQVAVDDLRSVLSQSDRVSFDPLQKLSVAGLPAVAQRYHTVYSKEGYEEYTFFIKGGMLYSIYMNTPSTCDGYPDTPSVIEAYQQILSSFEIQ